MEDNTNKVYNSFDTGEYDQPDLGCVFQPDYNDVPNDGEQFKGMPNNMNYNGQVQRPVSDTNATISLVLGILSILGSCCYGLPGLILGIIAVVLANTSAKNSPYGKKDGNAMAGFICGLIGAILGGIMVLFFIAAVIFAVATES